MIFTSVSLKILVIVVIPLFDPALVQPSWVMDYPGTWECPLVIGQNVSMKALYCTCGRLEQCTSLLVFLILYVCLIL